MIRILVFLIVAFLCAEPSSVVAQEAGFAIPITRSVISAEAKTVKLYGAGGRGLDSYQSGFYISDSGHILTVWSTVLDVDTIIAVTSDGGRSEARVVGIDPNLEVAILQSEDKPNYFFDLNKAAKARGGQRVFALSNLFGIATGNEMSSVQVGNVMAVSSLNARRGNFESVYQGPVIIIDAMTNNPGAAGGVLSTLDGRPLGMLGKELRDKNANTWLNYAIPIDQLKDSIDRIISGKAIARDANSRKPADRPASLRRLGLVLIPEVLAKTPAYIDLVEPGSIAEMAGFKPDDLILLINSQRVSSQAALKEELSYIDRAEELECLVQRGNQIVEILLTP